MTIRRIDLMGGPPQGETVPLLSGMLGQHTRLNLDQDEDALDRKSRGNAHNPPEKTSVEILLEFLKIFAMATPQDKFLIFLAILSTIAHALCFLVFALILGEMTDPFVQESLFGYGDMMKTNSTDHSNNSTKELLTKEEFLKEMKDYSLVYLVIAVAIFVLSFFQTYLWELTAENQVYQLRRTYIHQVIRQELPWFKINKVGEICYTLSDGSEKVREGIGHKFSMVLQYATIVALQIGFALLTNWKLTIIFLTISPLPVILAKYLNFGKLLAAKGETEQQKYAKASDDVSQALASIRRIFAFGKENYEVIKYSETLHNAAMCAVNKYVIQSIGVGVFAVLLFGSYAIAFQHGCNILTERSATLTDVYTVFFTVTIAIFGLMQILPWITTIASAEGSSVAVREYLELPNPKIDASRLDSAQYILPSVTGALKFDDVIFSYGRFTPRVLDRFDLDIQPGQNVGIIGYRGKGKSTVASLLIRFYDPQAGNITIDNTDIRRLDVAWYRKKVVIVPQKPVNFLEGTIMENIRAGRKDISDDLIHEAAMLLKVHDKIMALKDGYDTLIGGGSETKLDKNDKFRITIVRALVREPMWLVFDECLGALPDFKDILEEIRKYRKGHVTILIGNKTDDVKDLDVIHFVGNGRVVECGTFQELMDMKGEFFKMYQAEHRPMAPGGMRAYSTITAESDGIQLVEPEIDDKLVAQIKEEAIKMQQKYPGLWKMLKLTSRSYRDWTFWGLAAFGCALTGIVLPAFANFYTDIFTEFAEADAKLAHHAKFWFYMIATLAVVSGLGYCMRSLFVQVAGEFMILELRKQSLQTILAKPLDWFEDTKNSPVNLSNQLSDGVPFIKAALDNRFSIALSGIMSIAAAVIVALIMGWQFGVGLIASTLALLGLASLQIWHQRVYQRIGVALLSRANLILKEAIQEIWTIQSLSQETDIKQRYTNMVYGNLVDRRKSCRIFAFMYAFSETLVYLALAGTLRYGVYLIEHNAIEPIVFFRIFLIITFCLIKFGHTISFVPDYSKAELAFGRIYDLIEGDITLDKSHTVSPTITNPLVQELAETLKFDDVTYIPHGRDQYSATIENCTFVLPAGKTLAVIGISHVKLDFFKLILRFHEVSSGNILIGNKNIAQMDAHELRGTIAYVPQDSDLFKASITDNIIYGYQGVAPDFELKGLVRQVSVDAGLDSFVSKLLDTYDTIVDDNCVGMTRLIKMKIMIARALVRNPTILLLDEPTEGLNVADAMEIIDIIRRVKVRRTCIINTRDKNLAQEADLIGNFDYYTFSEFGSREDLEANNESCYYRFVHPEYIPPLPPFDSDSSEGISTITHIISPSD